MFMEEAQLCVCIHEFLMRTGLVSAKPGQEQNTEESNLNHIPNNPRIISVVLRKILAVVGKGIHICIECFVIAILEIRNTKPNKHFNERVIYCLITSESGIKKQSLTLQHLQVPIGKNDCPLCLKSETRNDEKQRLATIPRLQSFCKILRVSAFIILYVYIS